MIELQWLSDGRLKLTTRQTLRLIFSDEDGVIQTEVYIPKDEYIFINKWKARDLDPCIPTREQEK